MFIPEVFPQDRFRAITRNPLVRYPWLLKLINWTTFLAILPVAMCSVFVLEAVIRKSGLVGENIGLGAILASLLVGLVTAKIIWWSTNQISGYRSRWLVRQLNALSRKLLDQELDWSRNDPIGSVHLHDGRHVCLHQFVYGDGYSFSPLLKVILGKKTPSVTDLKGFSSVDSLITALETQEGLDLARLFEVIDRFLSRVDDEGAKDAHPALLYLLSSLLSECLEQRTDGRYLTQVKQVERRCIQLNHLADHFRPKPRGLQWLREKTMEARAA